MTNKALKNKMCKLDKFGDEIATYLLLAMCA